MEAINVSQQDFLVVENNAELQSVTITEQETVIVGDIQNPPSVVVTGQVGPKGASSLSKLDDIDVSELAPGATLVYQANNNNWKATKLLNNQIIECGQF